MIANVGVIERSVRTGIGLLLLAAVFALHSPWRWAGLIGLVPLATGVLGWCPIYAYLTQD